MRTLTILIVTAGRQSFSSSSKDRHTVPDGYTLGWKSGGSNLPEGKKILFNYIMMKEQCENQHLGGDEG
jgi:hypothetical protein